MLYRSPEGDGDDVVLRIDSGDESVRGDRWAAALLAAAGPDPFALVQRAVERAAALSGAPLCHTSHSCCCCASADVRRRQLFAAASRLWMLLRGTEQKCELDGVHQPIVACVSL